MALDQDDLLALDEAGFPLGDAMETARSLGFYSAAADAAVSEDAKGKLADLYHEVSALAVPEATPREGARPLGQNRGQHGRAGQASARRRLEACQEKRSGCRGEHQQPPLTRIGDRR